MKLHFVIVFVLAFTFQLFAQVSINGYLRTYDRFRLQQNGKLSWNENTLGLKFEGTPSDQIHYYSEIRLRGFGFPTVRHSFQLQNRSKSEVQPWGLEFREAYVDIYGFLTKNLDIRIGRQRIAWGTADKFNPTDNLNPDDLEDIFDFGRHLGSNAIKADYYLGKFTLTGVFIPIFTPATLPYGDWVNAFSQTGDLPHGVQISSVRDSLFLPENKLSESSAFAFKLATTVDDYDVSLSYYYGRDDLPLLTRAYFMPDRNMQGYYFTGNLQMIYPKMQVIGADMAGSIGSVGVWAEGAMFLPQKYYSYFTFPTVTQKEVALSNKPYIKFVVGGDYNFKNGWYVNGQYLHGFLHERGRDNLHDYFIIRFEKNFFNDALKISPFGAAISVNDWKNIKHNYGFAGGPEVDYYPLDALEVSAGAYLINGQGNNIFSKVKDFDETYFKVTYSF